MNTLTEAIAAVVRQYMTAQGETVNGLHPRVGMAYATLYRCVQGKRDFKTTELAAVAAELGMTLKQVAEEATECMAA